MARPAKRGPSRLVLPRWETPVPKAAIDRGDGANVLEFLRAYGRITKDSYAGRTGEPLAPRPWQEHIIGRIYARDPDGTRRHRRAMVGVGRKNGKTSLFAGCALYGLLCEGRGAEVYSIAADRAQARLVFDTARRMVALDPELSSVCRVTRDTIEDPSSGSIYRVLSSEAFTKEGLSPSLVIADELHAFPDRELYDVMSLAMGARVDPLMLIVTTAGVRADRHGQDTIAYQLYQLGRRIAAGEVTDPTFYLAWWEPHAVTAAFDDPEAWRQANPSLGDILDPDDMASALPPATPENEFRIKRLDQWVVSATSWLPHGAWEGCAKPERVVAPGEQVVLGFDGSWTNDSTALVGCTVEGHHLFVVRCWERPLEAASWVVPSGEVEEALLEATGRYEVVEVACDPHYWREQLLRWDDLGLPVTEWPTNVLARMVPACREFHTAVVERRLSHDGDPRLARHVANATVKVDQAEPAS
jgi:phage terminase large subunit-like protein